MASKGNPSKIRDLASRREHRDQDGKTDELQSFIPVCDAIASLFAPFAEVALHDLSTATVAHLAGNFSKRELGDPSNLNEIDFKPTDVIIGPYEKTNWDGRRIKAISVVMRTPGGKAVAVMCINVDVSEFDQMLLTMQNFVSVPADIGQPESLFRDDWYERINNYIQQWTASRGVKVSDLNREQKKELVRALAANGAFGGKNAAGYISRLLGMGRATVYNYLNGNTEEARKAGDRSQAR